MPGMEKGLASERLMTLPAQMVAPLVLSQLFATSIQRGGRTLAGVPFAFTSLVLCAALLLAARATRTTRVARASTA